MPGSTAGAGHGALTIEFQVEDVDAWFARLPSGTPVVKPPTTQSWGRRSVWLRDPDGNIVNLYQQLPAPVDPVAVVRTYFHRLLIERDLSACEDMLADDYVDHDAPHGTAPGPGATREYVAGMLAEHADLRFTIDHMVGLGRHVAVQATWHGRQSGLLLIRIDETGRIAERRSVYDSA